MKYKGDSSKLNHSIFLRLIPIDNFISFVVVVWSRKVSNKKMSRCGLLSDCFEYINEPVDRLKGKGENIHTFDITSLVTVDCVYSDVNANECSITKYSKT